MRFNNGAIAIGILIGLWAFRLIWKKSGRMNSVWARISSIVLAMGGASVLAFLVAGAISEVIYARSIMGLQKAGLSKEYIDFSSPKNTFAPAFFAAVFTLLGSLLWFIVACLSRLMSRTSGLREAYDLRKSSAQAAGVVLGSQSSEIPVSPSAQIEDGRSRAQFRVLRVSASLFGVLVGIYCLALGVQTEIYNIAGQVCPRANPNAVSGGVCIRPEWLSLGGLVLVMAFLFYPRRN